MNIKALPHKSTLNIDYRHRITGRSVNLRADIDPRNQGEKDLLADSFWAIYQRRPEMTKTPIEGRELNHALMNWLMNGDQFTSLHSEYQNHMLGAISAAAVAYNVLLGNDDIKDAMEKQNKIQDGREQLEQEKRFGPEADETAADFQERIEGMETALEAAEGELNGIIERMGQSEYFQAAVQSAAREGKERADEMVAAAAAWGNEAAEMARVDINYALEFAKSLSPKIKAIIEYFGRAKDAIFEARSTKEESGYTPTGAEFIGPEDGEKFLNIYPEELAMMGNGPDIIRAIKAADFFEYGLLGWEVKGEAKKAGDFILALDESYSMKGRPEQIAKGFAYALCEQAKTEGRNYHLGAFSDSGTPVRAITSDADFATKINWFEQFMAGGTDFDTPLNWALDCIQDNPEAAENADIVIVTDGWARLSEETASRFEAMRKETGVKLFYVPVGGKPSGFNNRIEDLADFVLPVESIVKEFDNVTRQIAAWMR